MRRANATLTIAVLVTALAAANARASPAPVDVRIEGPSETLFEGPILTEGHDVRASRDSEERPCDGIDENDPENVTPGPTPTATAVDAMSLIGETFDGQWYSGYEDYFITRWGPDEQSAVNGEYWGVLVNNFFTSVGGCQYQLSAGDEVLWVYNAFAGRPLLALLPAAAGYDSGARPLTATAELGKPFGVEVLAYGDQSETKPPVDPQRSGSSPFDGADVSPVQTSAVGFEQVETASPDTVKTNAEGKASITLTEPGWHRIKATAVNPRGEEGAIRSNRLDVCVPQAGASSCGEPPAEDQMRVPPYTAQAAEREEAAKLHTEADKNTDGSPSGGQPGPTGQGAVRPTTSLPRRTGHPANSAAARLTVTSLDPSRLLLRFTAAGEATVRIARLFVRGRPRHSRAIKTIAVKARKAGEVTVALPRLAAGRYRVSIDLAGEKSVVKILTVPYK